MGVSKQQSSDWQKLADIPEDEFEAALDGEAKPATSSIIAGAMRRPDPPAQRGQPARDGPDFWPTPFCLLMALLRFMLPSLPPGPIWECAAGDGQLVRTMESAGRRVIATDLYPHDGSDPVDFLITPPPIAGLVAVTNPPFHSSEAFLSSGVVPALGRGAARRASASAAWQHLQTDGRVKALNRVTREVHCNWRPVWIPDSEGNLRWSFTWLSWLAGERQPSLYLSKADVR